MKIVSISLINANQGNSRIDKVFDSILAYLRRTLRPWRLMRVPKWRWGAFFSKASWYKSLFSETDWRKKSTNFSPLVFSLQRGRAVMASPDWPRLSTHFRGNCRFFYPKPDIVTVITDFLMKITFTTKKKFSRRFSDAINSLFVMPPVTVPKSKIMILSKRISFLWIYAQTVFFAVWN